MKKILFSILFLLMIFHQRSNALLLPNFGQNQNTLVLKYSRAINGEFFLRHYSCKEKWTNRVTGFLYV
ncbi:hypothetical protein [Raineya orbicola]|uniref:hypothetical protein n=1 Tax=Raineya orbicola TaxID=2016530 RepID=UPI001054CCC6|nr:hypothetical protein [Raineya orbicola]MCS6796710.1 hypothetical protein [Raineya sp.]